MMDDPIAQFFASPHTDNQSASINQIENNKAIVPLMCVLAISSVVAIGVAFHSLGRGDQAIEEARRMRTEVRIIEDDMKYVRAYLSARGIHVPANHEEAEEK